MANVDTITLRRRRKPEIAVLSIAMPVELREELRVAAAKNGKQMSPFVLSILEALRPANFVAPCAGKPLRN